MNFIERLKNPLNVASFIVLSVFIVLICLPDNDHPKSQSMKSNTEQSFEERLMEEGSRQPIEDMVKFCRMFLPSHSEVSHNGVVRATTVKKMELTNNKSLIFEFGDDIYLEELKNAKYSDKEKAQYIIDIIDDMHPWLGDRLKKDKYTLNVTVSPNDKSASEPQIKYSVKVK